jgi:glycosyltransferase involved in cell wall biosynthesis
VSAPEVTIAIPVYNGAENIAETLASITAQSFSDFELLVVDDGSSDASLDIVARLADPRVRIVRFENAGIATNFERCIEHARGRYLKVLPQDDLLHPDCLAVSMELIRRCKSPALVFTRRDILWNPADPWAARWMKRYEVVDRFLQPLDAVNDGPELLRRWGAADMLTRNCIGEPVATLFPVELARSIGGFSKAMGQNMDFQLWIRLMARGDVGFSERKLCTFRLHASNTSRQNKLGNKLPFENVVMFRELVEDAELMHILPRLPDLLEREERKVLGPRYRRLLFWRRYARPEDLPARSA